MRKIGIVITVVLCIFASLAGTQVFAINRTKKNESTTNELVRQ